MTTGEGVDFAHPSLLWQERWPLGPPVADDELAGVFLTDTGLERIHHPYDGGADVVPDHARGTRPAPGPARGLALQPPAGPLTVR